MTPNKPRQHDPQGSPPSNGGGPIEVLPSNVRELVTKNLSGINPGLRLDKYAKPGTMDQQQQQLRELRLRDDTADPSVHQEAMARLNAALYRAAVWTRCTADSLTLHLARASVLENASICLHPIYGFPYLPGTGLKGLARAWAETVWSQSQPDPQQAWNKIHAVFGVGDETDTIKYENGNRVPKPWMPSEFERRKDHDGNDIDSAGVVVFHDAWPTKPPTLQIDFATPHHKAYYEKTDPPGDWDNPEPAAFLSVPAGFEFQFAISPTSHCSDLTLVEQARNWLNDALTIFGAGAKTNASYGAFEALDAAMAKLPESRFVGSTHKLTLTTPAFFAGDQSDAGSCRLRGGTLRGLLRWWWRTMHAGYLDAEELYKLERTIWGGIAAESDEGSGSAVSVRIQVKSSAKPEVFNRDKVRSGFKLPWPDRSQRITPGLTFLSYGMSEKEPKRHYLPSGASWELVVKARASGQLNAQQVHDEAINALWLLTHFGGLGAKSGKGFGCLALDNSEQSAESLKAGIQSALTHAAEIRQRIGATHPFQERHATPGSWKSSVPPPPVELSLGEMPDGEQGVWAAIHRLGTAIRTFCADHKHQPEKRALGTPRRMKESGGRDWPPRHTSPVHYYLFQRDGQYWVRVVAFPSDRLPDLEFSRKYLEGFIPALKNNIDALRTEPPVKGPAMHGPPRTAGPQPRISGSPVPTTAPTAPVLRAGSQIIGVLVAEKTKSGGWKAKVENFVGPIQNKQAVPSSAQPGESVRLKVKIPPPGIQFDFLGLVDK